MLQTLQHCSPHRNLHILYPQYVSSSKTAAAASLCNNNLVQPARLTTEAHTWLCLLIEVIQLKMYWITKKAGNLSRFPNLVFSGDHTCFQRYFEALRCSIALMENASGAVNCSNDYDWLKIINLFYSPKMNVCYHNQFENKNVKSKYNWW